MRAIFSVLIVFLFLLMPVSCKDKTSDNHTQKKDTDSFYCSNHSFNSFSKRSIDSIESFIPPDFNGTVLVYRRGKLYTKAFGHRDLHRRQNMQIEDMFQLASVSKPVTAVAVMQLVSKGLLDIDSAISRYMPDFPYPGVTTRHLLNHRSGLANYVYYTDTFWKNPSKPMYNKDLYAYLLSCKPKPYLQPGISFSYCNTNYTILASLVEKLSGMPFHRYVEAHIFKPAGMRNSYFYGQRPERIKGCAVQGRYDHYVYDEPYYLDAVHGDKSLISNVQDLFFFNRALGEGRILDTALLTQMQTASYRHNVYGGSYGLGFRLMQLPGGQWTYHNGWWRGFWTSFWSRFDKDICFVILTNNKRSSHADKKGLAVWLAGGN